MPEFYIRRDQVETYFRTEALEKPADVFRKVHTPIDQIQVEVYKEGPSAPFVDEDQVSRWILNSNGSTWGNRIFTITGETGSGKSELCQAIRYKAEETNGHVPILISRSMTRLRDIVSLLHTHLGEPEPEDIGEITALPAETVRATAVADCLVAVESKSFQIYTAEQRQKLRQVLQEVAFGRLIERAFASYKNEVVYNGKERVLELMDYDEFVNLMSGALPWLKTAEAFRVFRSQVNDSMKRLVSLGDLSRRLRGIAQRYQLQGKRPVLIMEDLTSFGFIKEDLLDYIFDLSGGNFDVVIGWTTGFEAEQLLRNPDEGMRTYMMDRTRGRFMTTSRDTRGSYFLERNHLQVVRRYMDAVRDPVGVDVIPDPFYPLNPYAITRIYQQLVDKGQPKRTPRQLLDAIGPILRSQAPPWRVIEEQLLGGILQDWALDDRFFALKESYPDAVSVLKWYGRPGDFKVDRRTIEMLGIEWPAALVEYLSDIPISTEQSGAFEKPAVNFQSTAEAQTPYAIRREDHAPTPTPAVGRREPPPAPSPMGAESPPPKLAVDQDLLDLQQWLDGKDIFPSRQKLKTGLTYLMNVAGGPSSIGNPRGQVSFLKYEKTTLPIVMAGTNDSVVDHPAIYLQPTREHYELFRICLKISSAGEAEVALTQNLRLASWVSSLVTKYRQRQREYLSARLGMPIEAAVFHAYRIVKAMSDGTTDTSDPAFAKITLSPTPLLSRTSSIKQLPNLRQLMNLRHSVAQLFQSFFFINATTLDRIALERVATEYPFARAAKVLTGFTKTIDAGFKFAIAAEETGGQKERALQELMLTLRQVGGELQSAGAALEAERLVFDPFEEIARFAEGLNPSLLKEQIATLRRLAAQHKVMERPAWQVLSELGAEIDFATLSDRSHGVLEAIDCSRDAFQLMVVHRFVSEIEEDKAYAALRLVGEMLHEVETALRELMQRSMSANLAFAQKDRQECAEVYSALSEALEG